MKTHTIGHLWGYEMRARFLLGALLALLPALALAQSSAGGGAGSGGGSVTVTNFPANPATSTNQASEIAALQAIQQRALLFQDFAGTASAVNATTNSTIRDAGANPNFTKVNFVGYSSQTGTYKILACLDSACAQPLTLMSGAITVAGGYVTLSAPFVTRYYQIQYVNGGTAASIFGNSSFTAN